MLLAAPAAFDVRSRQVERVLELQALDNSVPLSFGTVYATSAAFVADVFDQHAGWVDKLAGETPAFEPAGRRARSVQRERRSK
jgi:aldehyde dehydrogenase (NAD+)